MTTSRLRIVRGNDKLGNIPNLSTMPGPAHTCGPNSSVCLKGCYAVKFARWPSVRKCWQANTDIIMQAHATAHWNNVIADVTEYLWARPSEFFRWHVSGDFISGAHLEAALEVARATPDTLHLAYTKSLPAMARFLAVGPQGVPNFTLRLSQWPGLEYFGPIADGLPSFWLDHDERAPADAVPCPSDCSVCQACWHRSVQDVRIAQH